MQLFTDRTVEITCPVNMTEKILACTVGGIVGQPTHLFPDPLWCSSRPLPLAVLLLFVPYTTVKAKIASRKDALELEEVDKMVQQTFDHGKGRARRNSDSSYVSSLPFRFDGRPSSSATRSPLPSTSRKWQVNPLEVTPTIRIPMNPRYPFPSPNPLSQTILENHPRPPTRPPNHYPCPLQHPPGRTFSQTGSGTRCGKL